MLLLTCPSGTTMTKCNTTANNFYQIYFIEQPYLQCLLFQPNPKNWKMPLWKCDQMEKLV